LYSNSFQFAYPVTFLASLSGSRSYFTLYYTTIARTHALNWLDIDRTQVFALNCTQTYFHSVFISIFMDSGQCVSCLICYLHFSHFRI